MTTPKKNTHGGYHGGQRDSSGRKPDLLKVGKQFLYWLTTADGERTMLQTVAVTRYDRDFGIVELTAVASGFVLHLDSRMKKKRK